MATENMTLEEKVEKLIVGYKALQDKFRTLSAEKDAAVEAGAELKKIAESLGEKIAKAEADITAKDQEISQLKSELRSASQRAEKYEQSSKTAAAKIDDILSQLTDL